MKGDLLRVDQLLESIADGRPVDWDALAASSHPRDQRVLGHLRLVAGVAAVHRSVLADDDPASTLGGASGLDAAAAGTSWGHLMLVEKIGEGGFGTVYRARDTWLDRDVALKLLKPAVAGRAAAGLRIIEEARTLARVRHPNVVTVHGADRHDGRAGLWMELVRGRTLAQIMAAQGPFSAREAAGIGQELCRALAAVHAEHLVHRDIKAQNVMRESGGRIVLMDFGAGHTPLYLAPETLVDGAPTVASDIYALGVLLYHLVTGQFPLQGAGIADLRAAHARGERRRLSDQRPDLSPEFAAAVERALDPDPARRYGSAGEMQGALTQVPSAPAAPWSPVVLPARRGPLSWVRTALVASAVVLTLLGGVLWRELTPTQEPAPSAGIRLIAVLPLRSDDSSTQYFADGMTEALQQGLVNVRSLRVVSRTSVDRTRASAGSLPAIARALRADAILEGSVHHTTDLVRVNLRLIHAGSDTPVWSRSFEEPLESIFALQARVARAVADEWTLAILPIAATGQRVIDPAAYDAYLRGRHEYHRQTEAGLHAALEHFEHASRIEPAFARALLGMAQCYLSLGGESGELPQDESARAARDLVTRALRLDGSLAEAHATLASIKFEFDWDFAGAEKDFARAIELDPSLVAARENYSMFLTSRVRVDEALQQLGAARTVDPLSASVANLTAQAYYFGRRFDDALREARRSIQLDPAATGAYNGVGRILNAMGRYQEAIAQYQAAGRESSSDHPFFQSEIAQAEVGLGQRERALVRIRALESQVGDPRSRVAPYMLALAYAQLDRDASFQWFDREFERRSGHMLWLRVDPRVDPLRSDPRFAALLERLGETP